MSSSPTWGPRVGDAFGLALLAYLEHGPEGRSHSIERDDGLLETIDTGVLFSHESEWSVADTRVRFAYGFAGATWQQSGSTTCSSRSKNSGS